MSLGGSRGHHGNQRSRRVWQTETRPGAADVAVDAGDA